MKTHQSVTMMLNQQKKNNRYELINAIRAKREGNTT